MMGGDGFIAPGLEPVGGCHQGSQAQRGIVRRREHAGNGVRAFQFNAARGDVRLAELGIQNERPGELRARCEVHFCPQQVGSAHAPGVVFARGPAAGKGGVQLDIGEQKFGAGQTV